MIKHLLPILKIPTLPVIAVLMSVLPLKAQEFGGGVTVGLGTTTLDMSGYNKATFSAGVYGELGLGRGLYLNAAANIALNPWETAVLRYDNGMYPPEENAPATYYEVNDKFHSWNLRIPVTAVWKSAASNSVRFYIGVGPYIGFGLSGSGEITKIDYLSNPFAYVSKIDDIYTDYVKKFEAGLNAKTGLEINNHLLVGLEYNKQLTNNSKIRHQTNHLKSMLICIGYRF